MKTNKERGTIGFQAPGTWVDQIENWSDTLEVDKSEIAREAYAAGLPLALEKLKKEKERRIELQKQQLGALELHALCGSAMRNLIYALPKPV